MLKLGELFFRFRNYTPIPFLIYIIVFGDNTFSFNSIVIGTAGIVLGELIRIHGVAYIGRVSRTRSFSTGRQLVTGGPFSYVRNPLYIGNLLISGGLVITANVGLYFTLGFFFFFFVQYIPIIQWEESILQKKFGMEFTEYTRKVPRWFPALFRQINVDEKKGGDYATALKSETSTLASIAVLYILILWRSGWIAYWFPNLL